MDRNESVMEAVHRLRSGEGDRRRDENCVAEYLYDPIRRAVAWKLNRPWTDPLAEDVCQDAMLKVLKSLPKLQARSIGEFRSWAGRVAVSQAIDAVRRKRPDGVEPKAEPKEELVDEDRLSPVEDVASQQTASRLHQALELSGETMIRFVETEPKEVSRAVRAPHGIGSERAKIEQQIHAYLQSRLRDRPSLEVGRELGFTGEDKKVANRVDKLAERGAAALHLGAGYALERGAAPDLRAELEWWRELTTPKSKKKKEATR